MIKNWKTTVFGALFALATAISLSPDLVWEFFPKAETGDLAWQIIRAAKVCVFLFGVITAAAAKDRNVTGGTVPATQEAEFRT